MLRAALYEHLQNTEEEYYFPSYEIFVDELRDYRFSDKDMAHPNHQAQEYIWQRFRETYFSLKLTGICQEIVEFRRFELHRPRTNEADHLQAINQKRQSLIIKYPMINL